METVIYDQINNMAKKFDLKTIILLSVVLLLTIVIYVALVIASRRIKAKKLIGEDIRRKHIYTTVFRVLKLLVVFGGIVAALQVLGVNMSWLVGGIGLLVILVVLAVKDSFQDMFAGFTILVDKYFTVGDAVEFDGKDGIVVSFTVRTTKIEFLDDRSVISIANRNITKIRKLTHLVDIDLPLSYEEDIMHVRAVLAEICEEISKIDGVEKCELKGTQEFASSAVIYKIRFFCEPYDRPDIRRAALKTIQDGLHEAGIKIPYQQIDIHSK